MATTPKPTRPFVWALVDTPGLPKWLGGDGKYGANVFLGTPGSIHWTIWRNRPRHREGSLSLMEGYSPDAETAKAAVEKHVQHLHLKLPKSGLYFEARAWDEGDDELPCRTIEEHLELMMLEEEKERRILPARPEKKGSPYFYCEELDIYGETKDTCGRQCADNSPINGKNGKCKHHRSLWEPFGDELLLKADGTITVAPQRKCRVCGCTENNCQGCIDRTGKPCCWEAPDLCSACKNPAHA